MMGGKVVVKYIFKGRVEFVFKKNWNFKIILGEFLKNNKNVFLEVFILGINYFNRKCYRVLKY